MISIDPIVKKNKLQIPSKKNGILLLNFGGPNSLEEIPDFLYRLFSDPAILVGIPSFIRPTLAWWISKTKSHSSVMAYKQIGGKSPQLYWTQVQANHLSDALREKNISASVEIGMKSSAPNIPTALWKLRQQGCDHIVLLPLFPQYSTTTSGSCFTEVAHTLKAMNWEVPTTTLTSWPAEPDYLDIIKEFMKNQWMRAGWLSKNPEAHVLFSAHSLPLKIIARGDPYPDEIQKTIEYLSRELPFSWSLAFQSRNGKMPWLEPYIENELVRLGRHGIKRLMVVPVSFVSDHIETLYELDILYSDLAQKNGIEQYLRTPTINGDPRFGKILCRMIWNQLEQTD